MKPSELIDSYRQYEGQRKILNMILDLDQNSKIQKVGNPRRKIGEQYSASPVPIFWLSHILTLFYICFRICKGFLKV